ncbi:MAG: DUF5915 domain-containing protein, partial [Pirellula sp.]
AKETHAAWLAEHDDIVREELNVKEIHYTSGASPFVSYSVQPNFRRLGPRVGPLLPKLKQALGAASGAKLMEEMTTAGKIAIELDGKTLELDGEDIQVRLAANAGWAAAQGASCVLALNTELTPALVWEGIAKDAIRLIQDLRKRTDCQFTDRIRVTLRTQSETLVQALAEHRDFICQETLAVELVLLTEPLSNPDAAVELADEPVSIELVVVKGS